MTMEITAQLKTYRQSPRKVRLVTSALRGLDTEKALQQLKFMGTRAATPLAKLIKSAIANAEHNFAIQKDNLFIKTVTVDDGPTLKRWRARAFGRAAAIKKRTSHITLVLDEKKPTKKRTAKKVSTEDIQTVKKLSDVKKAVRTNEKEGGTSAEKPRATGEGRHSPKIFQRKAG